MPNITQTIPALTAGISQQPDEQKIPGQVKDMVNALPDVTQGLLKRPGGKYVGSLSNSTNNGRWFHYYRDETEQYIGQIAQDGVVRMWDCSTGNEKDVINGDAPTVTFNNINWSTQSGSQTGFDNPINFGSATNNNFEAAYNAINGKVVLGNNSSNSSSQILGSKVVATNITNPTGYFINDVELELVANTFYGGTPGYVGRAGIRNVAGPTSGSGTCTLTITLDLEPSSYLIHSNDEDIQTLTLNDFTYLNNRTKIVEMADTVEPLNNYTKEVFVELKNLSYAKQYALNIFDNDTLSTVSTATRIDIKLIKSSNNYCNSSGGMSGKNTRITNTIRCDATAADSRDAYAPNVGTRIFNISDGVSLSDEDAVYTDSDTTIAVKDSNGNNANDRENLYFRLTTTGQSVPFTSGSGENQTTTYQARYTTTFDLLHGGENWEQGDYFYFYMKNAYYKCTIEEVSTSKVQGSFDADGTTTGKGIIRPSPTPFDTKTNITAESILGSIREKITGSTTSNTGNGNTVTQIGNGLHIKRSTIFNASTSSGDLLNVVAGKVNDVGDLPSQCKDGMVVEVINSVADEDNYFVKFFGNNGKDGEGTWEECPKPGRKIRLAKGSMPMVLIRTADGNFRLTRLNGDTYGVVTSNQQSATFSSTTGNNTVTVTKTGHGFETDDLVHITSAFLKNGTFSITKINDNSFSFSSVNNENNQNNKTCTIDQGFAAPKWDDALVGDEVTNPEPSFVGKAINKMLFFRNRFAILADEHIVMSRPGDFTNFFSKSAISQVASDPIDIAASSSYPAILYDGIETNTGLILFSKNSQFMLTTDSDVFSPTTAKINALSTYNFNFATNPISLGTTIGFLDNAGKFSRFFEMAQVQREGEPQVIEQSAVVSRLFEKDLKLISNSRENSVVFFSEEGTSTLYGYKYFDQIAERKLASWFKWTLTGTIQYHCMQDDNLYVVVRNNNQDQLLKYAMKMDSNTISLEENRVHLDHLMSTSGWNYNATTNKSTKAKPAGLESTNQLVAYDVDSGNNLGRYGLITINGVLLELDGDWSGETFVIGYLYTMEVKIPTLYYVTQSGQNWRADTRAHTILHRVKFGFGPIGIYETTLNRTGKTDYTEVFEITPADQYSANTAGVVDDNNLRTIPIYDRNINASLTLKSTHPAPATIHNMTWEGVYTKNNYERV